GLQGSGRDDRGHDGLPHGCALGHGDEARDCGRAARPEIGAAESIAASAVQVSEWSATLVSFLRESRGAQNTRSSYAWECRRGLGMSSLGPRRSTAFKVASR